MSKAILIMDMPESCLECPIGKNMSIPIEICISCPIAKKCMIDEETRTRPKECPLKAIPEYDYPTINPTKENIYYAQGWNDCIDAILKGEEHETD